MSNAESWQSVRSPGQVSYEAYSNHVGGHSLVTGAILPAWTDLPQQIGDAWEAAARAVLDA